MNKYVYNTGIGCLGSAMTAVLAGIIYAISAIFITPKFYIGFPIAFFIANFLVSFGMDYNTKKKITGRVLRNIVPIITLLFIFFVRYKIGDLSQKAKPIDEHHVTIKDSIINGQTQQLASHKRRWHDYSGNTYEGELNVRMSDYYNTVQFHNDLNVSSNSKNFWHLIYKKVVAHDANKLDLIYQEFDRIRNEERLNKKSFAEMVVSYIQDIPYALVFQDECRDAIEYEASVRKILEKCPECCIGNQKYGIQTPVAFMTNLKGDCDTRTIMAFAILKHFNYDVTILNSSFYRHSILGIALPSKGIYKVYNGKRYYLWETTNRYFKIGELSAHLDNTKYWNVVLSNQ